MPDLKSEQVSRCSWCPSPCKSCTEDRDCECYTHQDEPERDALAADLASEQVRLTDAEREAVCRSSANHAKTVAAVERIVAERVARAKVGGWEAAVDHIYASERLRAETKDECPFRGGGGRG